MTHFDLRRRQALIGALAAGAFADAAHGQDMAATAATRRRLTVGMSGFPPALEPVLFNHTATRRVVPQMFDTLIAFDQARNMALLPALAEHWERIGPRALRLSLRKGVVFHDGSPFTAEDVAFSLSPDHLLGPDRSGRSIAMQTLERIERVEIVDPIPSSFAPRATRRCSSSAWPRGRPRSSANAPSMPQALGSAGRRRRSGPDLIGWSRRSST